MEKDEYKPPRWINEPLIGKTVGYRELTEEDLATADRLAKFAERRKANRNKESK